MPQQVNVHLRGNRPEVARGNTSGTGAVTIGVGLGLGLLAYILVKKFYHPRPPQTLPYTSLIQQMFVNNKTTEMLSAWEYQFKTAVQLWKEDNG